MKTETEKAIEYLKEGIKDGESLRELKSLDEREKNELTKSINKINMVITLLQQGEKYKKIVEELVKYYEKYPDSSDEWLVSEFVGKMMQTIKKYFPKEVKWRLK